MTVCSKCVPLGVPHGECVSVLCLPGRRASWGCWGWGDSRLLSSSRRRPPSSPCSAGLMAASARLGVEAGLINNLLLPQAFEEGRLHHGEKGEEWREEALAPQAQAALAPTAQASAPVPVSSKPELGKAYRVILPVPPAARPRQAAPQGTSPQPGH